MEFQLVTNDMYMYVNIHVILISIHYIIFELLYNCDLRDDDGGH